MRMKLIFTILIFATSFLVCGQEPDSEGDKYFFSYDYQNAIKSYLQDKSEGVVLTKNQILNLADAYFKTTNFDEAAKTYLNSEAKEPIKDKNRINMMLQSLKRSKKPKMLDKLWGSKKNLLSTELQENAEFNFQLLHNQTDADNAIDIFNSLENSIKDDFSPTIFKDKLLFSSSRSSKKKGKYSSGGSFLDIYEARITPTGRLSNAKKFSFLPNSKYHKSTPFYVEENNQFFYILSNSEDGELTFNDHGKNALAIGMVYNNGFFRYILADLSTSFYYPFFDSKTEKLYFAANFEDGFGGTDIYYVYVNNGQIMSEPINLGPRINSPGNEIAPYIHDGSMYFSSDVFYGIGGMDVYRTNIQSDDSFSIPVNLGSSINTEADDFGFIIKENEAQKLYGYFASNRPGGKGGDDLYGFVMNEKPGLKTIAIKGKVVDLNTNQGLADAQVRIIGSDGMVIKTVKSAEYGGYSIEIPYQAKVTVQSTKEGYSVFTGSFSSNSESNGFNLGILNLDDLIEDVEDKKVVAINKFFFASRSSELTEAIKLELDKVVQAVQSFPRMKLAIETHTDSRGYTKTNKKISQLRADAIKSYLLSKGVSLDNMVSAVGYGEEKIMNNCKNGVYCLEFLHNQNKRTLIVIDNYTELK